MHDTTTSRSNYAWVILVACIGFYAIPVGIIGNTSGIFVTPVMDEFGWSRTTATLYMTIQPWVAAVCTPLAGIILARWNPRWVLTLAVLIYGLATIWTAYADQPWQWNAYGVIYGVTCSFFMFLAMPTLINAWFTKSTGLAIGICGAALSLIAAVFATVGQNLIDAYDWHTARLIMGIIITVIPTVLTALFVRKDPVSIGALPWGSDTSTETQQAAPEVGATFEQAKRSPALYLLIFLAGLLCFNATFFQQIPSFTATGKLGADAGATAVSILMVGGIVGKFLLGWISDRTGGRVGGVLAGLCGAAGLLLALAAGGSVAVFYLGIALFGIGYAGLTIVAPMLTREGFGTRDYTRIYGWVSIGIFVFSGLGAVVFARIYDLTGSFTPAFILVIASYVVIAALSPFIAHSARRCWQQVAAPAPEATPVNH